MEKDKVTRIYAAGGDGLNARVTESYTNEYTPENTARGATAAAILSRADYVGVYHWQGQYATAKHPGRTDKEGYGFTDTATNERFDVSVKKVRGGAYSNAADAKVAKDLEKRSGKKGLTIITR